MQFLMPLYGRWPRSVGRTIMPVSVIAPSDIPPANQIEIPTTQRCCVPGTTARTMSRSLLVKRTRAPKNSGGRDEGLSLVSKFGLD